MNHNGVCRAPPGFAGSAKYLDALGLNVSHATPVSYTTGWPFSVSKQEVQTCVQYLSSLQGDIV